MSKIYVTAHTTDYPPAAVRLALDTDRAIHIGDTRWSTGVTMIECWIGRGRIVTHAYSIWGDGRGRNIGDIYRIIDGQSDILDFCHRAGVDVPKFITIQDA